jgi:hypothetical protein
MELKDAIKLKASELKLGDIVHLFNGGYGTATVKQIKDGRVTLFRPYVSTGAFTYTGGVICLIGIEEVIYNISTSTTFEVLSRSNNLK